MFLLDSDIATLAMREHERVSARLAATDPELVALTLITRLEMLRGRIDAVIKAASAEELLRACLGLATSEEFIGAYRIVQISESAAEQFVQLRANKKLKKIGPGDTLQAAIALATGATLVTRNIKDYASVPGLKLENWAD
ncbi:tRNA(fMet)-specific endonuclease VapC [Gemmata sp. SH-PL17]|uniref:type II toxin-antitoxin system VapC family toxin n=1 Tax=Gemmata sp. SH-PL17 TaxID=1630693 RepID=UPI00078B2E38|nr:type II toxin-antitoxin system VapC family toxin [Gemmata sp. SH-PL17]AMV30254.1 tRNA(fMet)-specific endonuclease VapC [Gemmata sp. SH-PL17]